MFIRSRRDLEQAHLTTEKNVVWDRGGLGPRGRAPRPSVRSFCDLPGSLFLATSGPTVPLIDQAL